ncbi:Vacuolar membrane amino acid uptake transporter fnx2 [Penicillium taxi]|uniref:Vacuolar membrane amino acid uptake transporter fnx2 n=1 Tax=Penicillium taxi TaxID=168475 RepID=UPI00254595E3|nr:Vacuolar membrane amino acid uptake transporter fnx2 [Penicillium taxi]KAJ5887874.1 Vacuolar membrane amino acid uptake transporter fnx2 [Penicillium taxi]
MAPLRQVAVLRMYIQTVSMTGVGAGAPIGGLIISLVGWRWSFLGQTPILFFCLVMIAWKLPKDSYSKVHQNGAQDCHLEKRRMDVLGIVLLAGAVSSFILLCSAFTETSTLGRIRWALVAALIIFGVLFVIDEAFWAKDPLIPLDLAATNGIGIAWTAQVLLNIGLFSVGLDYSLFYMTPANFSIPR